MLNSKNLYSEYAKAKLIESYPNIGKVDITVKLADLKSNTIGTSTMAIFVKKNKKNFVAFQQYGKMNDFDPVFMLSVIDRIIPKLVKKLRRIK